MVTKIANAADSQDENIFVIPEAGHDSPSKDTNILGAPSTATKTFKSRNKESIAMPGIIIGRQLKLIHLLSEVFSTSSSDGRKLGEDDGCSDKSHGEEHDEEHESTTHAPYSELYNIIVFLLAVFGAGQIATLLGLVRIAWHT